MRIGGDTGFLIDGLTREQKSIRIHADFLRYQ